MFRRASACLLLVLFFVTVWPRTSQATGVSLAIIGASALGAAIASSGAASYYAPAVYDAANTAVSSAGKVAHKLYEAQKVVTALGTYYVGKAVSELADLSSGIGWLNQNSSSIPALWSSLSPYFAPTQPPPSGTVVTLNGVTYKLGTVANVYHVTPIGGGNSASPYWPVGSEPSTTQGFYPYQGAYFTISPYYITFFYDNAIVQMHPDEWTYYSCDSYNFTTSTNTPTDLPKTLDASGWAAGFTGSSSIDQDLEWMAGQPGAPVSFVDSPTAAGAFSAPPVGTWGSTQQGQAFTLAGNQAAQDTATEVANLAASDPTNTDAQISAAQTANDATQADLAAQAQQAADNPTLPTLAPPTVPDFDFTPLIALKDQALTKFPFSLANEVGTFVGALVGPPETPAFTVPLGTFGTMNVDLHVWDDEMSWFRSLIAFLFYASVVYFIIKRWSS